MALCNLLTTAGNLSRRSNASKSLLHQNLTGRCRKKNPCMLKNIIMHMHARVCLRLSVNKFAWHNKVKKVKKLSVTKDINSPQVY